MVQILLLEAALPRKLLLRAVAPEASSELLVWSLTGWGLGSHPVSLTEIAMKSVARRFPGISYSPSVTDR